MLPTCRVHCAVFDNDGSPVAGAVVTAKLDRFEVYQGYVVPDIETATTDETGACTLALPDNQADPAGGEDLRCTELCTLDGVTYVAVPDGVTLPEQPAQIADTVQAIALTPELRDRIKAASPHCQFIDARMQDKIRARYSAEDEMYFARIGTGVALGKYAFEPGEEDALAEYGAHVEGVRQWGRAERAKLGL